MDKKPSDDTAGAQDGKKEEVTASQSTPSSPISETKEKVVEVIQYKDINDLVGVLTSPDFSYYKKDCAIMLFISLYHCFLLCFAPHLAISVVFGFFIRSI